MSDPLVREIGRIDIPGIGPFAVGIDNGAVTIGDPGDDGYLIPPETADELAAYLITATWQAAAREAGNG
jgi:hypothetical protein